MPVRTMKDITPELLSQLAESIAPEPVVTVVGDLNYDTICAAPPLEAGRRVLIGYRQRCLGGAAGVTASGLARLGARVRLVTCVGPDQNGRELLEEVRRVGVEVQDSKSMVDPGKGAAARGGGTAFTLIFTLPGEPAPRQVATYRGVLDTFTLGCLDRDALLRDAHALYACNYFIMPGLSEEIGELFAAAQAAGILTAYDANAGDGWNDADRLRTLRERIYPHTDVVFLNQDEAAALWGRPELESALRELCPASDTLVIKRGPRGALLRHQGRRFEVGAFPPAQKPRDTVGAGDSFQAGFLYFLLKGAPVEHAALLGAAEAASTLLEHGGTGGQLDRPGLRRFVSRYRALDCGAGGLVVEPSEP